MRACCFSLFSFRLCLYIFSCCNNKKSPVAKHEPRTFFAVCIATGLTLFKVSKALRPRFTTGLPIIQFIPFCFFQNAHQFFAQTGSDVLHETTDYLTNYEFLKKLYNEYQYLSSTFRKQFYIFLIYLFVFCSQSLLCMLQIVYGRRRKACVPAVFGITKTKSSQLSYTSDFSFPTACFRHSIRTGLKLPHSPFSIILSATSAESASL